MKFTVFSWHKTLLVRTSIVRISRFMLRALSTVIRVEGRRHLVKARPIDRGAELAPDKTPIWYVHVACSLRVRDHVAPTDEKSPLSAALRPVTVNP